MIVDMVVRQLGRRKGRTALTITGVAIGIILVTVLSSFSEGISSTINREMSLLSGKITVSSKDVNLFQSQGASELDESLVAELKDFPGVDTATGILSGNAPAVGNVYGISLDALDVFDLDVEPAEGRFPEEDQNEVILGSKYAESSALKVGDEFVIRGKRYDIVGVLESTGTEQDNGVLTTVAPAQDILKKKDKVSFIVVTPASADEAESLARDIEGSYDNVQALSEKDASREAAKFTGQISMMTFAIGSISAIIAGIGIMNVMFMSVRERRKEIGAMKALGATTHEILMQVIAEALAITLIGEAIGLLLSVGVVGAFNSVSSQFSAMITPGLLIQVTLFAIFLGVFSGLLPARGAAKLQPAVVLRYE